MVEVTSVPVEAAFSIGNEKPLIAITTVAPRRRAEAGQPWIVLLNAGIIHRIGPNRLYVQLARRLASRGHAVLRFDLAGIGDSEPPTQVLSSWDSALADIRQVLDWLQQTRGAERFVLVGLCSGADQAIGYAGSDPRVCGAVLLDPSIPRTAGQRRRETMRKLLRRRSIASLIAVFGRAARRTLPAPRAAAMSIGVDDPRARAYLEAAYRSAVEHAVALYVVCTNDRPFLVNYREQLLDAFPRVGFGESLRLDFDSKADHTFEDEACRARLIDEVADWCDGLRASPKTHSRASSPTLTEATNP